MPRLRGPVGDGPQAPEAVPRVRVGPEGGLDAGVPSEAREEGEAMKTRRRSILDALLDKAVEMIDNYDVSKLLEPKPKKLPPVKLKVLKVTSASPKAGSDARSN